MRPSNPVPRALSRTRSSLERLLSSLRWLLTALVAGGRRVGGSAVAIARGPVARLVRGPVSTLLVGRRLGVSVLVGGVAPVLAVLTAAVVASTTGYPPLERWAVGTWTGTDPRAAVFVGAAVLVGLAAASAAVNGGLLPTTVLVAAPLFGVAVTRYGTVVATPYGERVVSLPDAVAFAFGVAAAGGVIAAVVGYAVGAGLRRAGRVVGDDVPMPSRSDADE
jgi:hypothetical protein